jgi:fermentation-respiration switch protein FrsA (DUF1100 family)
VDKPSETNNLCGSRESNPDASRRWILSQDSVGQRPVPTGGNPQEPAATCTNLHPSDDTGDDTAYARRYTAPALSWRLAVLVAAVGCGGTDQRALADAPLAAKCAQMGGVWVKEWDAITNASGTFRCLKPLPLAEVTTP